MKANRAYHLIASRQGLEPAFLSGPERLDRIEVVSVEDGEVVLFWDLPAKQASKLLKSLRADLMGLDAQEFIERWGGTDVPEDS